MLNTKVYKSGDLIEGETFKHLAEDAIVKGEFKDAFDNYTHYFRESSPDFAIYSNARKAVELSGLPDSVLNEIKLIWNNSKTNRDPILVKKVDSLGVLDQKARVVIDYPLSIKQQDSLNQIFLKKIFENDTLSYSKLGHSTFQSLVTILFHLSRYEAFLELIPFLNISLENGGISPRFYAMLIDEFYKINISKNWTDSYYHTDTYRSNGEVYIYKDYSDEELKLIEERREAIGLENLDLQRQLHIYNICNGYSDFEFYQLFIDPTMTSLKADEWIRSCKCEVEIHKCAKE